MTPIVHAIRASIVPLVLVAAIAVVALAPYLRPAPPVVVMVPITINQAPSAPSTVVHAHPYYWPYAYCGWKVGYCGD